jgi:hypothetical protein
MPVRAGRWIVPAADAFGKPPAGHLHSAGIGPAEGAWMLPRVDGPQHRIHHALRDDLPHAEREAYYGTHATCEVR